MADSTKPRLRRWALHAYRVGVFVFLLAMIHRQHGWFVEQRRGAAKLPITMEQVLPFYPKAARLSDWDPSHGGQNVFDGDDKALGYVIQTSPEADHVVGFSGPTNTLVALDSEHHILGTAVLRSDDTKEHLGQVLKDPGFFTQWNGLEKDEAAAGPEIHAVSGATLTSQAIADSIATRLGGHERESRFPKEIEIVEVQKFLPTAQSIQPVEKRPYLFQVLDAEGQLIGYASRTSPHADHMIGYQGPTDVMLVIDPEERFLGLAIRDTFDNEPYVSYLTEDEYFFNTFVGFELRDIAELDMVDAGIDGVTGATKTSITVAEGLIETARELIKIREPIPPKPWIELNVRNVGTMLVVLAGLLIAFTRLKGKKWLRVAFQVVLVVYLGFINADMLSQALLIGWAQNGVAWSVAPGLVLLTAAALIAPIFTGRQVYCTHLCPYGAVQDWLSRRLPWQAGVKGWLDRVLSCLPIVLLAWVVIVAMGHLPFSLVGIEPFDAFVFRIAGWVTIAVAVMGLIASLFVTRAYCRYGCPTGAMLKFLRFSAASDRLGRRDYVAAAFVLIALGMGFWR
ncbi:MAG: FMN-binding protein [Verrucomicrobiae bacterium]|nr:FMN-binding protein [Verrucomicrobiae bacterium]